VMRVPSFPAVTDTARCDAAVLPTGCMQSLAVVLGLPMSGWCAPVPVHAFCSSQVCLRGCIYNRTCGLRESRKCAMTDLLPPDMLQEPYEGPW
jgi:hypothetical protein